MIDVIYYAHSGGSGHVTRSRLVTNALTCNWRVMTSAAKARQLYPTQKLFLLPPRDKSSAWSGTQPQADSWPKLPYYSDTFRQWSSAIFDVLKAAKPKLLLIDVSEEAAMLARLAGVPYMYFRQHGDHTNPRLVPVYQAAEALIAPYPQNLEPVDTPTWIVSKTTYIGGFSRFAGFDNSATIVKPNTVLILKSAHAADNDIQVEALAHIAPDLDFTILGALQPVVGSNVKSLGVLDGTQYAQAVQSHAVVLASAGHNTVMELADLGANAVFLPEQRPFHEQAYKTQMLESTATAYTLSSGSTPADIVDAIRTAIDAPRPLSTLTNPLALTQCNDLINSFIKSVADA